MLNIENILKLTTDIDIIFFYNFVELMREKKVVQTKLHKMYTVTITVLS